MHFSFIYMVIFSRTQTFAAPSMSSVTTWKVLDVGRLRACVPEFGEHQQSSWQMSEQDHCHQVLQSNVTKFNSNFRCKLAILAKAKLKTVIFHCGLNTLTPQVNCCNALPCERMTHDFRVSNKEQLNHLIAKMATLKKKTHLNLLKGIFPSQSMVML